jgi:hypothetical protein
LTLQFRHASQPALQPGRESGPEVLRSNTIQTVAPEGDVEQAPTQLQWQVVPAAAAYEVRVLEVDHNELWKARTSASRIALPPSVQARVVPAKTLLWQVAALDAAGNKVAESGPVRFRLLQNLHRP